MSIQNIRNHTITIINLSDCLSGNKIMRCRSSCNRQDNRDFAISVNCISIFWECLQIAEVLSPVAITIGRCATCDRSNVRFFSLFRPLLHKNAPHVRYMLRFVTINKKMLKVRRRFANL